MATDTVSSPLQEIELIGHSLEDFLLPYVNFITFGIDIAAGLIIGISALWIYFIPQDNEQI